jgi:hypothetical protein
MRFGIFAKYREQQYHTTQADGTYTFSQMWLAQRGWLANNSNCQFTMEMTDANTSTYPATTFYRYGMLANNSNVATSVAQRKDGRALLPPGNSPVSGTTLVAYPYMYNRFQQINYPAFQWQSGWAGSSRPFLINNIFHRPELVKDICSYYQPGAAGDGDNWNAGVATGVNVSIPYLINLQTVTFDFGTRGMKANEIVGTKQNRFPPNIKSIWISGSTQPITIRPKFPPALEYLNLSVTNATLRNDINRLLEDCVNMKALMLTNETWGDGSPAAMPVSGTLQISHMTKLIALSLQSTALTEVVWSVTNPNLFERLKLRSCTGLNVTTFFNLFNLVTRSTAGISVDVAGAGKSFVKTFVHSDLSLNFVFIVAWNNYLVGDINYSTSRVNFTYLRFGNYGNSTFIDGTGINATANSATAGTATIQFGGAGGAGGTNANGANAATASVYSGGGGGAGHSSGVVSFNGGAGTSGLMRITYFTGGTEVTNTFTSSGTFNVPADTSEILIECWGAGGGGGGRGTTVGASGGGGGGAYSRKRLVVTPSASVPYTVGVGGPGGIGLNNGTDGGDTYWDAGADVKAAGGKGGNATQTGGLGGAIADCIGEAAYKGGDGSTRSVNTSPGGGGGGGAGSTGTKQNLYSVNVTGLTAMTFMDMSDCMIGQLQMPVNTVLTDLGLGGNRLDIVANPTIKAQIEALSNLRRCYFSNIVLDSWGAVRGQSSTNGLGANWNFSAMTQLITLGANSSKLSGTLTLPSTSTLSRVAFLDNNVTGITGVNTFTGLIVLLPGNNPNFTFDFTRVPAIYSLLIYNGGNGNNTALTLLDLSARTSTGVMATNIATTDVNGGLGYWFRVSECTNLTEIRFPTTTARCTFTNVGTSNSCNFSFNPALTTLVNHTNITYAGFASQSYYYSFNDCALNINFQIGLNSTLPHVMSLQNNGMSQVNVDLNIDNIYQNRARWNGYGSWGKSLNISGTNSAPTGSFVAPTGFKRAVISAITRANPCVVTRGTTTGTFANDDVIFIRQATGMTQINNLSFTVKNVSGSTFELWNAAGTTAIDSTAYGIYNANTAIMFIDGTPANTREKMYILAWNYQWTITATNATVTQTQDGVARIQARVNQTIAGVANIYGTTDRTITGVSRLQTIVDQTLDGTSRIQNTVDQTMAGVANIV